jgi:nucleoside-diphosphate kinase
MIERSLVLIKPDAVERNLIGKILSIYEENDLKVVSIKGLKASKDIAELHYAEHKGRPYFEELITTYKKTYVALYLKGNAIKT